MKTLIATLILLGLSITANAAKVTKVSGGKALIDLEGDTALVGDQYFVIDGSGKKRGLLQVSKVQGGRAIATVSKGNVAAGNSLQRFQGRMSAAPSEVNKSRGKASGSKKSWGLMAGMVNSSMNVKSSTGSMTMTGSSFNLDGYYQTYLDKNISVKILVGYETLNVTGTASSGFSGGSCTSGMKCTADIGYLGMNALIRYSFYRTTSLEFSAGGGLGFLFAMQKSSNVLDTAKITTNQTIVGSLGVDWHLDKRTYVPIQLDYAMFPDNNTSSASQMMIRAGYGWAF
ncbi:hypothetical protein B9G69_010960 [Bdellovibrio sp. SKB1291214]|uniref:hypothetical protein n=1 Tax=Bdellovibrio sp. SKB1291214 TaxID=1732569 RepID=UPI0020CE1325|nr:hypothetical protein [Bdellovibrio sp. SKB1291214]UYL07564.1 hypothetical protein B9G69_010960 [Bdellovibrio sp. SKB1291214]